MKVCLGPIEWRWSELTEVTGYLNSNASIKTEDELRSDLTTLFTNGDDQFVQNVLDVYPSKDYESQFSRREAMIGDLYTNCPSAWMLAAMAKKNRGTWKMQFNAGSAMQAASSEYLYDAGFERKSLPVDHHCDF